MKPFATDLALFEIKVSQAALASLNGRRVVIRPFIGPDQAYAYVLTGRDLSEGNVKPLVRALLSMLESAEVCREEKSPLGASSELRNAADNTREAIQALGVGDDDAHSVMNSLFRGAIAATSPPPGVRYQ